jgi:hypothetical protein
METLRSYVCCVALAAVTSAFGCGSQEELGEQGAQAWNPQGDEGALDPSDPEFATEAALWFIDAVGVSEFGWKGRELIPTTPIPVYSVSDDEPSFFLVNINCAGLAACGYVVVNIDGTSPVIPEYDSFSPHPGIALDEWQQDASSVKFYRLSPLDWFTVRSDGGTQDTVYWSIGQELAYRDFAVRLQQYRSRLSLPLEPDRATRIREARDGFLHELNDTQWSPGESQVAVLPSPEIETLLAPLDLSTKTATACGSPLPCYTQPSKLVGQTFCYAGCAPTAWAMIYGFWDGNDKTALVSGSASSQTANVTSMIWQLNSDLGTTCTQSGEGSTSSFWTAQWKAANYGKSKGYSGTSVNVDILATDSGHYSTIKSQINAGRPIKMGIPNHAVAVYGWSEVTAAGKTTKYVKANTGWPTPKTKTYTLLASDFDITNTAKMTGL